MKRLLFLITILFSTNLLAHIEQVDLLGGVTCLANKNDEIIQIDFTFKEKQGRILAEETYYNGIPDRYKSYIDVYNDGLGALFKWGLYRRESAEIDFSGIYSFRGKNYVKASTDKMPLICEVILK